MLNLTNKKFYHIHTIQGKSRLPNKFTHKWVKGNTLSFGTKMSKNTNGLCDRIFNIHLNVEWEKNLIKELTKERIDLKFSNLKSNHQKKFFEKGFMFKYYQFTREIVLEEIRQRLFADRPSRLNGIWLTNRKYLKTWLEIIPKEIYPQRIYHVKFTGNAHRADGRWITNPTLFFEDVFKNAIGYWSGNNKSSLENPNEEFICNGTIEIISEVKSNARKY